MKRMDYLETDTANCSLGRTVELVGQPWVVLILREVVWGVRRFSDMQAHMGVSKSVLSDRLDHLVEHGVLERRDYQQPGQSKRFEYHLTPKGADLYPVLTALRQWGDKYLVGKGNEPVLLRHETCGHRTTAHLACDHCGEKLAPRDATVYAGPGYPDDALRPPALRD